MPNHDITSNIKSGSKARLIPVVADSKKEERATSVLLSMFMFVPQFAEAVLNEAGAKVGQRSTIRCYTEIVFNNKDFNNLRPDGLIVITLGKKTWSALVEAKVGNNNLDKQQIESYLDLAKEVGADALITISNQFATLPTHHPIDVSKTKVRSVDLFHFSWMAVLSKAVVISNTKIISDVEQAHMLKELVRYLNHPSSGVSAMTSMSPAWKEICNQIQQGAVLKKTSKEVQTTITSWHQLFRYLAIDLSMSTSSKVTVVLPKSHANDPTLKLQDDIHELISKGTMTDELNVPNAASNIGITADFTRRVITVSMKVETPKDKTKPTAPINWLVRQLKSVEENNILIRAIWPGREQDTQDFLTNVLADSQVLVPNGMKELPKSIIVLRVIDLGAKFKQPKNFVELMLSSVSDYYRDVGQHLNKWVPKPPKAKEKSNSVVNDDENEIGEVSEDGESREAVNSGYEPPKLIGEGIVLNFKNNN